MTSISYTKVVNFLVTVYKKKFFLLQLPIVLFISIPLFNTFMMENSSRNEGQALVLQLQRGEISMTDFQQELTQLTKSSAAKNRYHLPLVLLLCMKFLLYYCAILSTIIIGLSYSNNRTLSIPSYISALRSLGVLFSYFLSIALFLFPVGFTLKILNGFKPLTTVIGLILLISLVLFLFLTSCFSLTIPIILNEDSEIYQSIRKSYRICKKNAFYMLALFVIISILALFIINIPVVILGRILPSIVTIALRKYTGGLLATIPAMIFVGFYHHLTTPDTESQDVIPPHGA